AEVRAREAMVAAYISGRPVDLTAVLLTTTSATDLLVRTELLADHVAQRTATVEEYLSLRGSLDGAASDVAGRAAANQLALADARAELASAEIEVRDAERVVTVVASQIQLEAERRAGGWGRPYKGAGSDGSPTPEQSGNARGLAWDLLRWCESGGNYAAVSPGGHYRGAYQFSPSTWNSVAGRHYPAYVGVDPAAAPSKVQDSMARALFSEAGRSPWPVCGQRI
ncbi:MAG: transglycosylase family protein, partial [Acidimicrobiales bacterium]|nr:transglycosylase family protein [Acidimicrobiales bacterium]